MLAALGLSPNSLGRKMQMKMKTQKAKKTHGDTADAALYERFTSAMRTVPEGKLAGALDCIEFILRRALHDHGPDARMPLMPARMLGPSVGVEPLLDVLAGHTVAEGARVMVRLRADVAKKLAALGADRTFVRDLRSGGPRTGNAS